MHLVSLGNGLAHGIAALFVEDENLEALKVRELTATLALSDLLSPGRLVPLLLDLGRLPLLGNDGGAGSTRQLGDDVLGQSNMAKVGTVAGDASLGAVHEDTLVVNDLDNGSELTSVGTTVDQNNATKLDLAPVNALDFRHWYGYYLRPQRVLSESVLGGFVP